jgi:hypothetical protein
MQISHLIHLIALVKTINKNIFKYLLNYISI